MIEIDKLVLERIDAALARAERMKDDHALGQECLAEVVNICEGIYGTQSIQLNRLTTAIDKVQRGNPADGFVLFDLSLVVLGNLRAMRGDVVAGRLKTIIHDAVANLILDFVSLAERAMAEDRIDVAAVLAAASFEDLMRRRALDAGLQVTDKDLSDLINALKAAGALGGAQARVAAAYVTLRNKALHAEWSKISVPEVASLIGFVKNSTVGGPGA